MKMNLVLTGRNNTNQKRHWEPIKSNIQLAPSMPNCIPIQIFCSAPHFSNFQCIPIDKRILLSCKEHKPWKTPDCKHFFILFLFSVLTIFFLFSIFDHFICAQFVRAIFRVKFECLSLFKVFFLLFGLSFFITSYWFITRKWTLLHAATEYRLAVEKTLNFTV